VEAAVAEHSGQARLRAASGATAGLSEDGKVTVTTVSLDDLVFARGLPAPSVMKIDVEGAEAAVLRGAGRVLAACRPAILLSTHSPMLRAECHRMLGAAGYSLVPEEDGLATAQSDEVIAVPPGSQRPL
jgi:hypothetical protein